MNKKKLMRRLKQASTWRGFILSLGGIGTLLDPADLKLIVAITMLVAGLVGILTDDGILKAMSDGILGRDKDVS